MGSVFPRMISLAPPLGQTKDLESGEQSRANQLRQHVVSKLGLEILRSSICNILLLFIPVGIPLYYAHVHPVWSFVVNILAMIPLAGVAIAHNSSDCSC